REFGVHRAADFIEREFFVFGEDEYIPLEGREQTDSFGDDHGAFAIGDIERWGDDGVVIEIAEGSFAASAFKGKVARDAKKEAPQRAALTIERAGVAEESDKGVVDQVLSGGGRSGHPPGEAEQDVFMRGVSGLKIGVH